MDKHLPQWRLHRQELNSAPRRVIADVLGIRNAKTTNDTTVYDPGSGSLLLKVGDAASAKVTLYGQEKDSTTAGLARMNMILHNNPTALIVQGNTLADLVRRMNRRAQRARKKGLNQ